MQDFLEQIDLEWVLINASKELLTFVKGNANVTYADAIKFARENDPKTFEGSKTGLVRRTALEKLFEKYKQEAIGIKKETGREVVAEQLIGERFKVLERILKNYPEDEDKPDALTKEFRQLQALLNKEEQVILGFEKITEDEALRHDIVAERANKVFIKSHLGKYNVYKDKEDGTVFQIAILHPNQKEKITGADLIYEQYDVENKRVRIAAIQYKIWDRRVLYFSQASNALQQIKKLEKCFCDQKFCTDGKGSNFSLEKFRMPFCVAFLRPTDKLQNPRNLITSGFHLPICKIEKIKEYGYRNEIIRWEQLKNTAINSYTFEELFNAEMVGSRWLEVSELERFYQHSGVLEDSQNLIIHAQDMSTESKKYLLKGI